MAMHNDLDHTISYLADNETISTISGFIDIYSSACLHLCRYNGCQSRGIIFYVDPGGCRYVRLLLFPSSMAGGSENRLHWLY